jgi:hypothetical protein
MEMRFCFSVRPSLRYLLFSNMAFLIVLVSLGFWSSDVFLFKLLLAAIIVMYAIHFSWNYWQTGALECVFSQGVWRLSLRSSLREWGNESMVLCRDSLVLENILMLHFKSVQSGEKTSVIVLPDNIAMEQMRKLQIVLRTRSEVWDG